MTRRKPRWWKTPRAKALRKKYDKRIKAACKKVETRGWSAKSRAGYQAACWNYMWKRASKKFLREYGKGSR